MPKRKRPNSSAVKITAEFRRYIALYKNYTQYVEFGTSYIQEAVYCIKAYKQPSQYKTDLGCKMYDMKIIYVTPEYGNDIYKLIKDAGYIYMSTFYYSGIFGYFGHHTDGWYIPKTKPEPIRKKKQSTYGCGNTMTKIKHTHKQKEGMIKLRREIQ